MTEGGHEAAHAELLQRIGCLSATLSDCPARQLASDLDVIRRLAIASGLGAMTPIIHALEAALARGERGSHLTNGFALLHDAIQCGNDPRGIAALAAVCSRRMVG